MGLFNKKKEETNSCCCVGNCTPKTMAKTEASKSGVGVKVLGSGCVKCKTLENATHEALVELGMDTTIETVVLLSKLNTRQHIEVEVKMDELDLTAAESKATYEEIKAYVLEHTGLKVSHLYIAQIKQKYGIIERENYNKPKSENSRQPKCPPEKEVAITEALKYYGMM